MKERSQSNGAVNCCCRYPRQLPPTYLHDTDHLYHNKGASYNGKLIVPAVKVKVKVPLEATTRQDKTQMKEEPNPDSLLHAAAGRPTPEGANHREIGRASCRERV